MSIDLIPIGVVTSGRTNIDDDTNWSKVPTKIELDPAFAPEALEGLEQFSHAEVLFYLHRIPADKVERTSRHPRGNPAWPTVGIFAQRGAARPNRIAATIVRVIRREGRTLVIDGLDAVNGTPVLDIKPVMREFLPRTEVRQPAWVSELMRDYWAEGSRTKD